jgi:hypothetical protein
MRGVYSDPGEVAFIFEPATAMVGLSAYRFQFSRRCPCNHIIVAAYFIADQDQDQYQITLYLFGGTIPMLKLSPGMKVLSLFSHTFFSDGVIHGRREIAVPVVRSAS